MRAGVRLAEYTTLGVGGPALAFVEVDDSAGLIEALHAARAEGHPVLILGGGSNLLVSDAGFPGVVIRQRSAAIRVDEREGFAYVRVDAGCVWDDLVAWTVDEGYAGLECTSGIPGLVGAAPIQNVGAYGQEVGPVVDRVHAVRLDDASRHAFTAEQCEFAYRDSRFKGRDAGRYVVTRVDFRLRIGGAPTLRYPQVRDALGTQATLLETRDAVIRIRRQKSMVLDPADPNARSAGSFFVNPILSEGTATRVAQRLSTRGVDVDGMPRHPAGDGRVKLSAAWLIERSGFERGYGVGPVGLSQRHTLAIVNRGGATAAQVVALAAQVRRGVRAACGVVLDPEPRFVGFDQPLERLLS